MPVGAYSAPVTQNRTDGPTGPATDLKAARRAGRRQYWAAIKGARDIIDLGRDGGVVIGTHSISPEIPLEHFVAYHHTCRTYGVRAAGATG